LQRWDAVVDRVRHSVGQRAAADGETTVRIVERHDEAAEEIESDNAVDVAHDRVLAGVDSAEMQRADVDRLGAKDLHPLRIAAARGVRAAPPREDRSWRGRRACTAAR